MSNILARFQLLELNVISAQDLAPAGRSMRTYAVAWIDPDRKLSTRVDSHGGTNPTWNDKFVFRIDEDFFYDDKSVITIDIYALHWFRDIHVGTAHVLSSDLVPPPSQTQPQPKNTYKSTGMRFMGLQVQRPSGRPKGILNVGAARIDSSMRSMPLYIQNSPRIGYSQDDHDQPKHQAKPELRRTKSDSSSMLGSEALVPEPQAKTKRGKANSQVPTSEISTKSKKKASSILSSSFVKGTPKDGKLGRKKAKVRCHDSQNNFNARVNVDYLVKSTPKREFQNSPLAGRSYNNNNNNNYIGSVRATPLHAFAVTDTTMEYGTPYRSNLGRRPFMTDSELGPSASEVAAVVARLPMEEGENSTVGGWSLDDSVEGLQPKVERWQTELPPVYDGSERSNVTGSSRKGKHARRQTDGSNGLFSCFSVICGVECSIVCGGGGGGGGGKKHRRRRVQSVDNESFL